MVTKEQLLASLSQLKDPEYGISLADLNFVRDVMIKGNHVSATVLLSNESDENKQRLQQEITAAFKKSVRSRCTSVFVRFPISNAAKRHAKFSRRALRLGRKRPLPVLPRLA